MNGDADGIRLKSAHGSIVRNNTTHSNNARGINVVDTDDVMIFNNLTYANVGGIQIGGNESGSQRAIIQNNTVYGNEADGILIGTGPVASTGARVRYNIIDANGQSGLQLDDNLRAGRSAVDFCAEHNIVHHNDPTRRYGPIRLANCPECLEPTADEGPCAFPMCRQTEAECLLLPPTDRADDPLFVRPVSGVDGCLGGRRFWDDAFWLSRQLEQVAIDLGRSELVHADSVDLDDRATEACDVRDREFLDAGFHAVRQCFTDLPPLAGDCNQDMCVTVNELVTGVNVVLDRAPLSNCPAFDLNENGIVTVNELVSGVNDLFCCTDVTAGLNSAWHR
jgi:parallel beta-helix repeat protein